MGMRYLRSWNRLCENILATDHEQARQRRHDSTCNGRGEPQRLLELLIIEFQERFVAVVVFPNYISQVLPCHGIKILTSGIGDGLGGIIKTAQIRQPR